MKKVGEIDKKIRVKEKKKIGSEQFVCGSAGRSACPDELFAALASNKYATDHALRSFSSPLPSSTHGKVSQGIGDDGPVREDTTLQGSRKTRKSGERHQTGVSFARTGRICFVLPDTGCRLLSECRVSLGGTFLDLNLRIARNTSSFRV